jgi:mono/diheme cytochrome c family protein
MKNFLQNKSLWLAFAATGLITLLSFLFSRKRVDYISEVKPIFNKKCIACHGGVRRNADFSLLFRSDALAPIKSGKRAIVPGEPEESELIKRITHDDPEERMPKNAAPLSKEEIATLRRWIVEGATWGDHWAYLPVQKVEAPKSSTKWFEKNEAASWAKNDVDFFVYEKLKQEKLTPAPAADKATLRRRASLDLIGIPAPDSLGRIFLHDTTEAAYENLVDALLASPRFGERWASMWLDLARYADTKGYERDDFRTIWRYRDWVIRAFNEDKPYDQFLTEQLAGDLLLTPTEAQLIATAFHRNTMTNDEGGTDNEEFRVAAVIDRVNTTWEALQGTTFACVQCHSHPYDPFRHEEYYKFMAFFNNTRDHDTYEEYPVLRHFSGKDSVQFLELQDWLHKNVPLEKTEAVLRFVKTYQPARYSLTTDRFVNSELADTKWLMLRKNSSARLAQVNLQNKTQLLYRYIGRAKTGELKVRVDALDGPVIATIRVPQTNGWRFERIPLQPAEGVHDIYFTYSSSALKTPEDNGIMFDWFYFSDDFPGRDLPGFAETEKKIMALLAAPASTTPIMLDNPPELTRKTRVFERGNWLVQTAEVQPEVPKYFPPLPDNAPRNRLGLAQWLTSTQHPLTARVMVNRLWEQLFGAGLVETLEDFGTQGASPAHVELLDWLAWRFMHAYDWSVKKILKKIVMSATYQQDSRATPEKLTKDPYNKFLSRGAKMRLSGEQMRDQALAVAGLLSEKMYGRGVYPFQPGGIWLSPWNGATWQQSKGEDQYRRAIYTFWKRSAPYPSMLTFDATQREVCTSRRVRTNTPLQAMVTLNDPVYLEAARRLALRMQKDILGVRGQIAKGYSLALGRVISESKLNVLEELYGEAVQQFQKEKANAKKILGGEAKNAGVESAAALVIVANAIMNLDEFVTK